MVVSKKDRRTRKREGAEKERRVQYDKRLVGFVLGHLMIKGARARLHQRMLQQKRVFGQRGPGVPEHKAFPMVWRLSENYAELHMRYVPMLTDQECKDALPLAGEIKADFAVLHIRSNDLAKKRRTPKKLAKEVFKAAHRLVSEFGVKHVFVIPCLLQGNNIIGFLENFNSRRLAYNTILRRLGKTDPVVTVRTIHGFERSLDVTMYLPLRRVMKDLIHPNTPEGARKYMTGLRSALLRASGVYKRFIQGKKSSTARVAAPCPSTAVNNIKPARLRPDRLWELVRERGNQHTMRESELVPSTSRVN